MLDEKDRKWIVMQDRWREKDGRTKQSRVEQDSKVQ